MQICLISQIQRILKIDINRTNNIVNQLEVYGIVDRFEENRNRKVKITNREQLEVLLKDIKVKSIENKLKKIKEDIQVAVDKFIIDVTAKPSENIMIDISTNPPVVGNTTSYNYQGDYWGLGTKNKEKLNLSSKETLILNDLIDTNNKFNSIEFCSTQIIRMFFRAINDLQNIYKKTKTSLEEQSKIIAEIELIYHYKLKKDSINFETQSKQFLKTIYQVIYKICEDRLRGYCNVSRNDVSGFYVRSNIALDEIHFRISPHLNDLISKYLEEIGELDNETEAELNKYGRSRWKVKLEEAKNTLSEKGIQWFYDQVIKLGNQNKDNPSVELIFYDASKFIAKIDKEASLKLYVHYINFDLLSVTFDNRQLVKGIQKSLLSSKEQQQDFEKIINEFIADRDLNKAIQVVSKVYTIKRKKIKLDDTKINEVQKKHAGTVDLLNEYLKEEEEKDSTALSEKESDELSLNINYNTEKKLHASFSNSVQLTDIQKETLLLFSKNGFAISFQDIETYAKERSVFRNSLIESLNESCFEFIDDNIIEEDNNTYTLVEEYYQKLIIQ